MIRHFALPLLLGIVLGAQDKSPMELLNMPVPKGLRHIAYGRDPLQFGELLVPAGKGPHPVVVVVHGGCWMAKLGKMDDRIVSLELLHPLAGAFAEMGIATWNIEYRRLGNDGGGWPGTFQDVANGADYMRKIAEENQLDLNRVVSMGHSAGGHLAMWLAARARLPSSSPLYAKDPLRLKGVVDLDGPPDLRATLPMQVPVCGAPVVVNLLGGTPEEQPQRYREGSPVEMLPLGVRQEILAGRMFAAQTPVYEAAARSAGDTVHSVVMKDAGHFVFLDPGSTAWPEVVKSTRALLGK